MEARLPLLCVLACVFTAAAHAADNPDALADKVRSIFEHCRGAVVKIQAVDEHGTLYGTGFFIDPSGTLYTSYTIGGDTRDITVLFGGEKVPARRLLGDSRSGIAILKIEKQTPFLALGKSSGMGVSSPVMTVGYPMELPLTPAIGLVAGFDVKYLGRFFSTAHIRASLPVERGEGGAPLLNMRGEAVGVLISSIEDGNGCFVLPIEAAQKVHKDFLRFGEVRPGWVGMTVAAGEKEGVQVQDVAADAPAAKSGVKKGDVLVQVGNTKIKSPEDVLNASFYLTADDEVSVTVLRAGETLTLKIEPVTHPSLERDTAQVLAPQPPGGAALLKPEK